MKDWLGRARDVLYRMDLHRAALAAMGAGPGRIEDQWKHEVLTELVRDLERFGDPDPHAGTAADVAERLVFAETITKRTVDDFASRWAEAIASIADMARTPKYGGMRLSPRSASSRSGRTSRPGCGSSQTSGQGGCPSPTDTWRRTSSRMTPRSSSSSSRAAGSGWALRSRRRGAESTRTSTTRPVKPFFAGKYEVTRPSG